MTTVPSRSLTTASTFLAAPPRETVQRMVAPTSTTLTLAVPQRTVADLAAGRSLLRIRPTTRVTSMIGLAGWSANLPVPPAASTWRRVTS